MQHIRDEITQSIITALESGVAPWVKPWTGATHDTDRNLVSQKPYRGINRVILMVATMSKGYAAPVWATYKQWQAVGANVRKGEHGTKIVFFSPVETIDKATGETSSYAMLKSYTVFNAGQVDGYTADSPAPVSGEFEDHSDAEAFIAKTGAIISHGGDKAFYMPSADRIQLPAKSLFSAPAAYYATALHELTHWTSHESRCDRDLSKGRFGNSEYAFEELVAELGAAFLCNDLGVSGKLQHAEYIGSWLKVLKNDNTAIFKAAALAQKASDYLLAVDATLAAAA